MVVRAPGVATQALRFAIVGVLNTATTLAIIAALREVVGAPVWLASAIGYGVGTVQSYLLNRSWTFGSRGGGVPVAAQFSRFVAVNVVLGLVFSALNDVLARQFTLVAATLLTMLVVVPMSFLAMRTLVFGRGRT